MDMKLFKHHLANAQKQHLTESAASAAAQKTAKAYDDFLSAAKKLLAAWSDTIEENEDAQFVDGWPLESLDDVVEKLQKFEPKFKQAMRQVK